MNRVLSLLKVSSLLSIGCESFMLGRKVKMWERKWRWRVSYFYFQITEKGYTREVLALNSFHGRLGGSCSLMTPAHFHQTSLFNLKLPSCRTSLIFQPSSLHHHLPILSWVFSPVMTFPSSVFCSFVFLAPISSPSHSLPPYPKFNRLLQKLRSGLTYFWKSC